MHTQSDFGGSALMTNFQCLTLASWDDVLYRTSNGVNLWLSRAYHTTWIFVGAWVVVQLALAVLAEAFVQVIIYIYMYIYIYIYIYILA